MQSFRKLIMLCVCRKWSANDSGT